MRLKLHSRILLALLALAVIALLAPMAVQAQGQASASFQVKGIAAPTGSIPVDGVISVKVPWSYTFSTGGTQVVGNVVTSATLAWDNPVKCDPAKGITVTGSFSEVFALPSGAESSKTTVSMESTFNILASSDAPGETPITCTFTGKVLAAGAIPQTASSSGSVPIKVAYRGLITATVPLTIQQAGPQKQITYAIQVSNVGNSESTINFRLEGDVPEGWQPIVPSPIILTSPNKGGTENSKEVSFVISTPYKNGWNNKETRFVMTIEPVSTKDTSETGKGQAIQVQVLSRVRGIYVPGPEPALAALAIVATALVARKLRK